MKKLAGGRYWTQAKKFEKQLVADDKCTLCGEKGDLFHRLWLCKSSAAASQAPDGFSNLLWSKKRLLYTRGLVARLTHPQVSLEDQCILDCFDGCEGFDGDIFSDGSTYDSRESYARCGWAVVQLKNGWPRCVASGNLPHVSQHTNLAELYAVVVGIKYMTSKGSFHLHSDCQWVVEGFAKSESVTTNAGAVSADLWRLLWLTRKEKENSGVFVNVIKCKAHMDFDSTWSERSKTIWLGNHLADHFAKKTASKLRIPLIQRQMHEELQCEVRTAVNMTAKACTQFLQEGIADVPKF